MKITKNIEVAFSVVDTGYSFYDKGYYALELEFDNPISDRKDRLSFWAVHCNKGESQNEFLKRMINWLSSSEPKTILIQKIEDKIQEEFTIYGNKNDQKELEDQLAQIKLSFEVKVPTL